MFSRIAFAFLILSHFALPAHAADDATARKYLGAGNLFVNDVFWDLEDRWRTGSMALSFVSGRAWEGGLPQQFGDLIEYRFLGEIIAPENLTTPAPGDRPYAGALSFGAHTHFARGQTEFSVGADLVITGPQTGLDEFQNDIHDWLGMPGPSATVLNNQIEDGFHPTAVVELGREFDMMSGVLRPFAEMRAGIETYARVGFDLSFGLIGANDLLVRDPVTGHRYRSVREDGTGIAFVFGADVAKVWDSTYLPESRGYVLSDTRDRARAGVHWQGEKWGTFFGLTWLGKEFVNQRESQVVGALSVNIAF